MARTKAAARRRQGANAKNDRVPAVHTPALLQHDSNDDSDSEDEMDIEVEGGVSLAIGDVNPGHWEASASNPQKISQMHHQMEITELDSENYIWHLPVAPVYQKRKALKNRGVHNAAALEYHNKCRLIKKHWSCSPEDCLPANLRCQTPYSFAMLAMLQRFACRTKQNFPLAQAILIERWRQRCHELNTDGEHTGILTVKTTVQKIKQGEQQIRENVFGLMLIDVEEALKTNHHNVTTQSKEAPKKLTSRQKRAKQQKALQEAPWTSIAEGVVQRRRKERREERLGLTRKLQDMLASQHDAVSNEDQTVAAAPPNSPVQVREASLPFWQNGPTSEGPAAIVTPLQEEDDTYNLSKAENIQYNQARNLMNKMGIEWTTQSQRARLRRLKKGGLSRRSDQSITLPSERMDLNKMASLYTTAPMTSPSDLAQLGQVALPEQQERVTRSMRGLVLGEPQVP